MVKTPLVTIIVLNWNGKRFIDSFFDSVQNQTYPKDKMEIIFVDNASTDDSVTYFESKNYTTARLVETGGNYGYAGGNNHGLREAKGEYIAVCNNDLVLDPQWLEQLVKTALDTDADVVVPKLVYAESKLINNAGSMLVPQSDWPNAERGMNMPADSADFNKREEITAFCGASPLFKRSFLKEVGIFDKRFFLYWEDVDLSWRGQKAGKKYLYEPQAVAYHYTSGSTGGESSRVFIRYVSRNRLLVLLKHGLPKYILKAFLKVARDHIAYKLKDLWISVKHRSGRKVALQNLSDGMRILCGAVILSPIMLCKRWKLLKEEAL